MNRVVETLKSGFSWIGRRLEFRGISLFHSFLYELENEKGMR